MARPCPWRVIHVGTGVFIEAASERDVYRKAREWAAEGVTGTLMIQQAAGDGTWARYEDLDPSELRDVEARRG